MIQHFAEPTKLSDGLCPQIRPAN